MELGYANDWAKYISSQGMTVEEALSYIRTADDNYDGAILKFFEGMCRSGYATPSA